jgi:hypothetical protein
METLAVFGALNVTPGAAVSVMTPAELPPGSMTWTAREIHSADAAFAAAPSDPSLLNTWLLTSAAFLAWKEATFMSSDKEDQPRKDKKDEESPLDRS